MQIATPTEISAEVQMARQRFGIVGNTPALLEAVQRAIKVAPIDLSVLVTGESGTGKEFFPQIIHQFSARKHAKYIAVNCGAIPEGTIDSELFGHEKGSFTGAVASRKGYFEEADGGTIFLDEVAELPLITQARLLRVLETGEYLKVGSSVVQKTNIRIVAATNVDMAKAVAEGKFREDLYYRLSTVQISIPPLRERGTDIMLLAKKFASDFSERYQIPRVTFSDAARRVMLSYRWPGNVRQLKNVVEQMSLFEGGKEISLDTINHYLPKDAPDFQGAHTTSPTIIQNTYERERDMLFNWILHLQQEIADLRKMVDTSKHHKGAIVDEHTGVVDRHFSLTSPITAPADLHAAVKDNPVPDIIDIDAVEATDDINSASTPAGPIISSSVHTASGATLEDTERETIRQALLRNDGRRKAAAIELDISERTLYRKIKEYGLE